MSLINDALKKAQRVRTGESAPTAVPAGDAGGRIAKRGNPMQVQTMLISAGVVGAVVLIAVATTIFLMRRPSPAAPPAPPHVVPPVAAAPVAPPVTPAQAPAPAPLVEPKIVLPKLPPAPSMDTLLANPPAPAPPPDVAPAAPTPAPAVVRTPDPKIVAFIDNLKITGIRVSKTDSKVLMNDRVYRLNDSVDVILDIRLTGISADTLTFMDARGVVYTRNF